MSAEEVTQTDSLKKTKKPKQKQNQKNLRFKEFFQSQEEYGAVYLQFYAINMYKCS